MGTYLTVAWFGAQCDNVPSLAAVAGPQAQGAYRRHRGQHSGAAGGPRGGVAEAGGTQACMAWDACVWCTGGPQEPGAWTLQAGLLDTAVEGALIPKLGSDTFLCALCFWEHRLRWRGRRWHRTGRMTTRRMRTRRKPRSRPRRKASSNRQKTTMKRMKTRQAAQRVAASGNGGRRRPGAHWMHRCR